ncbi:MAG: nucleotide exchange factor GrpE [Candidatus Latescibacteria bacterium]|jgi:molecular chaperone GrpE|nr:nucleotide exchange factor GrpE [Candidatus Latescibacterota bacterium]MBT4136387.1 nucleotide exchange factor GrpE [Candidatus Latescibacterota bacterium]MBT5829219.1 nucleotide exchange factor GrpE [Candidatus Latescibacterota bacterium]
MEEKDIAVEDAENEPSEEEVDDNVVDMPEAEAEGATEEEPVDELTKAQQEAEMYKDRWMRLAAEFENYKRRTSREFDALIQSASEDVIRDLLPILDGVARALAHRKDGQEETEGYQEGVAMLMEQFPKILQNRNLKEIETVGQPFDPNVHEALMQMVSDTIDAGNVTDVVENGYILGEKVLRPAKVVVSQGKAEEETNK